MKLPTPKESVVHKSSYLQGFEDGYRTVLNILDGAILAESTADNLRKKMLNNAFSATVGVLTEGLDEIMQEMRND